MCGIFGYIGKKNPVSVVLEGLKKLEYRGYDSAGIVGIHGEKITFCKSVGKIASLETLVNSTGLELDIALGQTRWATHGKPNWINAHPHFDTHQQLALVHNGIIENYSSIRQQLQQEGITCVSDTDTEVIAHLIASHYRGDMLEALKTAIPKLEGAFAIAIVHRDYPETLFAVAYESPLAVGFNDEEIYLSSDSRAFSQHASEAIFLGNREIGVLTSSGCDIHDLSHGLVQRPTEKLTAETLDVSKGRFEHFTLKEIHEQPETVKSAILNRYNEDEGTAFFEELEGGTLDLSSIERIVMVACGTSWHAAYVAAYMIEETAGIPVDVEISSEFKYKSPVLVPGTIAIAISQSGETADTLACVRLLKKKGVKTLGVCNVSGSTLTREVDTTLFLRAGPEIGVCSTKAFTSQLMVLFFFGLLLARQRSLSLEDGQKFIQAAKMLPLQIQKVLDGAKAISVIAKKYAKYEDFFFIGRNYMYPTGLECALKLKEISYINANGYPAGEVKHGSIALIDEKCPTVALCANRKTFDKLRSNLMEVKARSGLLIAIASDKQAEFLDCVVDDIILVPDTIDELAPVISAVAAQLLAYYIALERGTEIDQPRNLAKSVTVE